MQARGEIRSKNLNIVVGEDDCIAMRLENTAVVSFAKGARIVNADNLDRILLEKLSKVCGNPCEFVWVYAANDY